MPIKILIASANLVPLLDEIKNNIVLYSVRLTIESIDLLGLMEVFLLLDEAADLVRVDYCRVWRAGSPQGTEGVQRGDHEQSESVTVASVPCDTTGHPSDRRRLRTAVLLHADSASL